MKICYVLPHFYPYVGGSEQAFLDLICEVIKDKNNEVRVITTTNSGKTEKYNHLGIDIYGYDWKIMFGHPLVKKKDLIEHIKWADVVHAGVYNPVIPSVKLCKKYKKPCIVTAHEVLGKKWYLIEPNRIKALMFKAYEKLNIKVKCDYFHVPSEASKIDLLKENKKAKVKKIFWISEKKQEITKKNTKSFYNYFGITKDNITFLNYGRPGKTKGIFVYLNAIKDVVNKMNKKELENIRFCFIMAKEPMTERIKFLKEVKDNNLEKYVIVKESVSREDLNNYINCCDYVVVPSITEGFGLTAIEACERGKKLIHSSAGSLPEVTFGSVLEFKNQDSKELASCIEKVIKNPDCFKEKEKKDFTGKTIAKQFINLYKEVINNKE